jgi:N-acetylmuramoyl-L-alanine amidase
MSWLKLTSESMFLMKGGTNEFLEKIDLKTHGTSTQKKFELDVPKDWLTGSDAPRTIIIDIGSTEKPNKASSSFDPDNVFAKVIKRSDWNASPPTSRFEIVDRPEFIVIHHTDDPKNPSQGTLDGGKKLAKDIQEYHMSDTPDPNDDKPWSDIGYNFLNTVGGHLIEGRFNSLKEAIAGNSVRGAHAGMANGNRSPGIANEGNFSINPSMSKKQWENLVDLCAALCQSCDIDPSKIRGHRDFVNTNCPGDWLYGQLPQLIKDVAKKLAI